MGIISKIKNRLRAKKTDAPKCILNINSNLLLSDQKRILLCYIISPWHRDFNSTMFHPNVPRCAQMVYELSGLGYTIDVCDSNDLTCFPIIANRKYDIVLGFGALYEEVCKTMSIPVKMIYVTENDPTTIESKFNERLQYFKQRHPEIKETPVNSRTTFYKKTQFDVSNCALIMTNDYNSVNIRKQIPNFFKIKCNGFKNPCYVYSSSDISTRRKNFLWFGSTGLVQKGLDILIDVFRELPEYSLNVYGANKKELESVKHLIPQNVFVHDGKISVQSEEYLNVINQNLFIISASCLEGMQSGVSTCMRHGLIPMLTKECGYEDESFIIHFSDYHVETIKAAILELNKISDVDLAEKSQLALSYAEREHTLSAFSNRFRDIVKEIEDR